MNDCSRLVVLKITIINMAIYHFAWLFFYSRRSVCLIDLTVDGTWILPYPRNTNLITITTHRQPAGPKPTQFVRPFRPDGRDIIAVWNTMPRWLKSLEYLIIKPKHERDVQSHIPEIVVPSFLWMKKFIATNEKWKVDLQAGSKSFILNTFPRDEGRI